MTLAYISSGGDRAMREFVGRTGIAVDSVMGRVIWEAFPRLLGHTMHGAMVLARSLNAALAAAGWPLPARLADTRPSPQAAAPTLH